MVKRKIIKILIGSNNKGKIKEIRDLLPQNITDEQRLLFEQLDQLS